MEIDFANGRLKKLCNDTHFAMRKIGLPNARKLQTHINYMKVANNVGDVQFGSPHPLKGNRKGEFALNLSKGYRLVFKPKSCEQQALIQSGKLKWAEIDNITIIEIGDYHE